jgi:glycosyltransferase involved in cell wall biosynthesis
MNLTIVVPVKNESGSIKELVERTDAALKMALISYEIIFVNDGSTDTSEDTIKRLMDRFPIHLISRFPSKGKAFSVIDGVRNAHSSTVVMIDGDLQYPPEAIPEMYALRETHSMVVAKRVVNSERFIRKIASEIHSFFYCKLLFGLTCDVQAGLKLFPKSLIDEIRLEYVSPWTLDLSLVYAAKRHGYTIGEVPVTFLPRSSGNSKVSILRSFYEHTISSLKVRFWYK